MADTMDTENGAAEQKAMSLSIAEAEDPLDGYRLH